MQLKEAGHHIWIYEGETADFYGFPYTTRLAGINHPHGKTPLDWRLSFIFGKDKARQSLERMLAWVLENIIVSHGECIFAGGGISQEFAFMGMEQAEPVAPSVCRSMQSPGRMS